MMVMYSLILMMCYLEKIFLLNNSTSRVDHDKTRADIVQAFSSKIMTL